MRITIINFTAECFKQPALISNATRTSNSTVIYFLPTVKQWHPIKEAIIIIITPFTFLTAIYSGYRHCALIYFIYKAHSSQPSFHQSGSRIHYFPNHCNGFNFNFCILKVKQRRKAIDHGLTDLPTDRPMNQRTIQPNNQPTNPPTNSMQQRPSWKVKGSSDSQEIPCISQNPKVHYHPPLVPVLSHVNPVHTTPSYFFKIHFNVIPPPMTVLLYVSRSKPCLQAMNTPHKFMQVMWHHYTQYLTFLHAVDPW